MGVRRLDPRVLLSTISPSKAWSQMIVVEPIKGLLTGGRR